MYFVTGPASADIEKYMEWYEREYGDKVAAS